MFQNDIKNLLALITVAFFFAVVVILFFTPIPAANLDLIKTFGIALITSVGIVIGYYFGSSDGSARKTELMSPPTITPAEPIQGLSPDKGGGEGLASNAGHIRLPLLFCIAAFACIVALTGCAATNSTTPTSADTPLQTAGKSLLAVKSTIVTAATATDALCKADKIPAAQCSQAKAAYETAKPAYDSAVDAYLLYSTAGGDAANFNAVLLRVQNLAANLLLIAGGAH